MDTPDSIVRKVGRWVKRLSKLTLLGLILIVTILVVGLIPVNSEFQPATEGIKIYIVSNAVHADVIVPVSAAEVDWSKRFADTEFMGDIGDPTHVAFGWGDRGFFLRTRTWNDFEILTAANALLLPSKSCTHVSFTSPNDDQDLISVTISPDQYSRMAEFIDNTFEVDDQGKYIQIPNEAYSTSDAFFASKGHYHFFNTCNSWVGRCLKVAGVKTPWLTPLPKTPMIYIQSEENLQ